MNDFNNDFNRQRPTNAEQVVSGVLTDVATTAAISSAYYANRLLDFRRRITSPNQDLRVPGVASEPSDTDVDIAWRLIRQIEQAEGTRLQDLDEKQVSKYVIALSKSVGRRTRKEYRISRSAKQDLVKKALSRVMANATGFRSGTVATVKPSQSKRGPVKPRGRVTGSFAGRPKKPHPTAHVKIKPNG